jgi:hypothetical protein
MRIAMIQRLGAATIALAALAGGGAVAADTSLSPDDFGARFEVEIAPYIWMAGLNGTLQFRPDLPVGHVSQSFHQILDALDAAFMTRFAVRRDRFGLSADVFYVATVTPIDPVGILYGSGAVDHSMFVATVTGGYRAIDEDRGHVDVLAGARLWSIASDLTLVSAGIPPDVSLTRQEAWIDPIVGVSGRGDLTNRLYVTGYADIGGFRSDSFTWQLEATLGYSIKDHFDLSAGYRILHVRHDDGGVTRDISYAGPLIAATLRY